ARLSSRSLESLPAWTPRPFPTRAGAVLPRSTSPLWRLAWSPGVQLRNKRLAVGVNIRTLSPQLRLPSKRPLPVATSSLPEPGTTTTPERAQIAELLCGQLFGFSSPVDVRAERVPDVHDAPGRRIDGDDVPLVGRLI